tara:strand:- start:272 stop:517 length:246 start_codon:yes stop_codon:yes gene_type:complete
MNTHSQKIKKENAKRIRFDGDALQALGSRIELHGELMTNGKWRAKDLKEFKELCDSVQVVAKQLINDVSSYVDSNVTWEDK